jgi:hypothetical protein
MSIDWDTDKTWKRVFEPKIQGIENEKEEEDEELINKPIIGKCLININFDEDS